MKLIGDYIENSFEGLNKDIPITAIARTIETDLLEMLNKKDIPAIPSSIDNIFM